jgi:hypothetical protein
MVGSIGVDSMAGVFRWIMQNEGWTGLFRGNAVNVLRVAPSKAIEVRQPTQVSGTSRIHGGRVHQ